jgi:DNA-binding NarL/FixJ family response regulator
MLRVLVADMHEVVRRGVRRLVSDHLGWELSGEACDGHEALEAILSQRPDVAILDVSMPTLGGVEIAQRLRREAPGVNVLLFTTIDDDETIAAGLAAGARGYLLKTDTAQHLEAAISALAARRLYFSPRVSELLLDAAAKGREHPRQRSFTARETEVARLMADGHGNSQIAHLLEISVKTVESHRAAAMRKAGSRTAAGLIRFAIKQHLIDVNAPQPQAR